MEYCHFLKKKQPLPVKGSGCKKRRIVKGLLSCFHRAIHIRAEGSCHVSCGNDTILIGVCQNGLQRIEYWIFFHTQLCVFRQDSSHISKGIGSVQIHVTRWNIQFRIAEPADRLWGNNKIIGAFPNIGDCKIGNL